MASESRDYLRDPSLSLKEKLQRRMREKKPVMSGLSSDPVFLNRWGPWILLFLLCGAGGWGTVVAMPVLYAGWWEGWLVLGRVWVVVMVVEATVNWSLTRWVSSEYRPDIHGTKPSSSFLFGDGTSATSETAGSFGHSEQNGTSAASAIANSVDVSGQNGTIDTANVLGRSGQTDSVSHRERPYQSFKKNAEGANDSWSVNIKSDKNNDAEEAPTPNKPRSYDGYSYKMFVAVALPTASGHVERKSFPYWSWVRCLLCQRERPPRCHHCTLCQVCVLKRDHHCYMTGACIGVNNQRFFLVFLVWGLLLTVFGTAHMLPYTFYHVVPDYNISMFDFIPPVSLLRGLLGYVSLVIALLAVLFWLLLFFVVLAVAMLGNFAYMLVKGKTSFERDNGIKVTDTRSLSGKLRSVFGEYWWLNFLVPTYPWLTPEEDAVLWTHIKPC